MRCNIYQTLALITFYLSSVSNASFSGTEMVDGHGIPEMNTCRLVISKLKFKYTVLGLGAYSKYWDAACGYPPATGTFLLCAYNLQNNDTSLMNKETYKYFAKRCASYSSYDYDAEYYKEQFENATENYVSYSSINTSLPLYKATLPKMSAYASTYKQYKAMCFNSDSGTWFSVGILGYFLLLILISGIFNLLRRLGVTKAINKSKISKLIQKFIIFPALIPNGRYTQPYGWKYFTFLIGNRIQFIVELILIGLQIAFYCVNYRYAARSALPTYVGYRSGVMAFGKIPLLILFAGRNNFIIYITGWSFSTCLHYHKVLAFWMSVDTLIHSVAFTIAYLGKYVSELHETYYAVGVAATVFCGVIIGHSFHSLRSLNYEIFLVTHIVLVICFLATCWYHCITLGNLEWIAAACCVWFFERLIRAIRMALFGYKTATVAAVADQLFRVEVPKPSWWYHTSGTYGYIYFLNYLIWENNPFTTVVEGDKICAYIRVKKGVTARIWKKLQKNEGSLTWRVCIEGPYGGELAPMYKKYDDAIYIAGGSGVPGILDAAMTASSGKLIWITQTLAFISAYKTMVEKVNIPIEIYITRENAEDVKCSKSELLSYSESDSQSTDGSTKESTKKESDGGNDNQISIHYGKPDVASLIDCNVRESPSNNVAIVACGPPVMMDNIRSIVSKNIYSWDKSVDFFNEFQTW